MVRKINEINQLIFGFIINPVFLFIILMGIIAHKEWEEK
jgi:hypothetical protein